MYFYRGSYLNVDFYHNLYCLDYAEIAYLGLRDNFFKPLLCSKIITGSPLLTKKV